ncbi:hypothetical protein SUGI_0060050 [Cryptomeria japonica]|uniref:polyribonucleotide nucleotidyltransferase 2, mitochondrial n=1 Tax=Cryptomeria japonica TaxID=3369 RepID=UPI002408C826|nr:polyribonucleotide nucleotidyltransferase 2, mitochondrial [Cryptomeria japonica]GLJ07159.1 hypothetical protein SUGI_0060050 [Cryptomeria japonica]
MGTYKYVEELWKKKQSDVMRLMQRARSSEYRELHGLVRVNRSTRPDKSRRPGYKAKQGLDLGSYVRRFSSSSGVLQQISVDEPSSWRQLPDMGEVFTEEVEVGSRLVRFETGKLARFAAGAVVLGIKETKVLTTVVSADGGGAQDFLPLTVDYRERQYAQGKIPNTFMRREGAPKERELLCGRVIDRSIRPLFPTGFYNETQVIANVLSSDGEQDPDVMAATAASAALTISNIPWNGPVAVVRVGRINGKLIVNPDMDELSLSDLNLVYSCTREKTLMMETQAREISNKDFIDALRLAHSEAVKLIDPQLRLAAKVKNQKMQFKLFTVSDRTLEKVKNLAETSIQAVFSDPNYGKFERGKALNKISNDVKKILEEEEDEESLSVLAKAVDTVRKKVVRKRIFEEGLRVDGRSLDEIRPLFCEAGSFPSLHGSSIFSRGNTQVMCTVTLGAPQEAQHLDSLVGPPTKRFMVHYSFPPFSINEVGRLGGLNRREVGHGTLAEKALLALLPPEYDFPYTVRLNSDVMASDGSTSMATVCGGSLALMDAGVPLKEHVAGISIGLVTDVDPSTGDVKDYRILTDILGLEDHLGDMDFKIAGTRKGVTAIQLDIKPAGIPLSILCECLDPALKARTKILDFMEQELKEPREQDKTNSPRIVTVRLNRDHLPRLIGHIRNIEKETGARIQALFDGTVTILGENQCVLEKAQEKVDSIVGREIEVGGLYKGVVTSIKDYGAFVNLGGDTEGLLHISQLSHDQISRVSDVVSLGQQLTLKCIERDVRGNIKLSLKDTLQKTNSEQQNITIKESNLPHVNGSSFTANSSGYNVSVRDSNLESVSLSNDLQEIQRSDINILPVTTNGVQEADALSLYSSPSVVIRSADECDMKRYSQEAVQASESKQVRKNSQPSSPKKKQKLIRKVEDTSSEVHKKQVTLENENERSSQEVTQASRLKPIKKESKSRLTSQKSSKVDKMPVVEDVSDVAPSSALSDFFRNITLSNKKSTCETPNTVETESVEDVSDVAPSSALSDFFHNVTVSNKKSTCETPYTVETESIEVHEKPVLVGDHCTVRVQQIRTFGLVLQMANGDMGMLRFEAGARNEFEVGEELQVKCMRINDKGVPVFSLLEMD